MFEESKAVANFEKWIKEIIESNGGKPHYLELEKLKETGNLPNFKDSSDESFYTLFMEERLTQREIAELFGVTIHQVEYRRSKLGLIKGDNMSIRLCYLAKLYTEKNPEDYPLYESYKKMANKLQEG